jgi:glutamine synthetase
MSRYVLYRLSEKYEVHINIKPKPMKGNWNGSGCHINFSTKEMREEKGYRKIVDIIKNKLSNKHSEILDSYGSDNNKRLTGQNETSSREEFTYDVGTRNTSVRIPNKVFKDKKGYFEDRRPGSNIDPYLAMGKLLEIIGQE